MRAPRALLVAQADTERRAAVQSYPDQVRETSRQQRLKAKVLEPSDTSALRTVISLSVIEVAALVRRLIFEVSNEDAANKTATALASSHVCGKTLALCTRDHFVNDYNIKGPLADHLVEKRDELVQSGVPRSALLP